MLKFFKNLQFIFKPFYWAMNSPYSKEVDEIINELLDEYEFTEIEKYKAKLGKIEIWIANHPYGSMTLYNTSLENLRPSRLTIQRAHRKLTEQIKKDILKDK